MREALGVIAHEGVPVAILEGELLLLLLLLLMELMLQSWALQKSAMQQLQGHEMHCIHLSPLQHPAKALCRQDERSKRVLNSHPPPPYHLKRWCEPPRLPRLSASLKRDCKATGLPYTFSRHTSYDFMDPGCMAA